MDNNNTKPAREVRDFNGEKVPAKTDPKKIKKTKRFILLKFKINASIGGYKSGSIITLKCDKKSKSPKARYWRRRIKDSVVDNCIEAYKEKLKRNNL